MGLVFSGTSTAANATINANRASALPSASSAGNAIINNNRGLLGFSGTSTAANAVINNNSSVLFAGNSTAGNATIITSVSPNFIGNTSFQDNGSGGLARFITNSGARFDISGLSSAGMTAGSIEGAGNYFLGSKQLTVGGNNLSTEVSGVIQDSGTAGGTGGSLVKVGAGTLVLSGANTYSGPTTINAGTLQLGDGGTSGSIPATSSTTAYSPSTGPTPSPSAMSSPAAAHSSRTAPARPSSPATTPIRGATAVNAGALW